jgi:hypothetical protein
MSQRLWRIPGDDAFLAGLFQDLGILLLFQTLGRAYARFLNRALHSRLNLGAMETQTLGFSHTALSARLLTAWHLPEGLSEAVAWWPQSPKPAGLPPSSLAQILHLSELIARLVVDGRREMLAQLLDAGRTYLRVLEPQLEPLVADVEEKVRQLADILSLELPDGLEYRDVLSAAHRELAAVAVRTAEDMLHVEPGELAAREEERFLGQCQDLAEAVSAACQMPAVPSLRRFDRPEGKKVSARPEPVVREETGPAKLLDRLSEMVAASRQSRTPLSLLLVEPGRSQGSGEQPAAAAADIPRRFLEDACHRVDHPRAICQSCGETGFAIILPDCQRRRAVELGDSLIQSVRRACAAAPGDSAPVKLAVGVATVVSVPKNFPVSDLFNGAARCLYGSHAGDRSVVKSIEIY